MSIIETLKTSKIGSIKNILKFHTTFFNVLLNTEEKDNFELINQVHNNIKLLNIINVIRDRFNWFSKENRVRKDGKVINIDIKPYEEPCELGYGCDSLYLIQLHTILKFNLIIEEFVKLLERKKITDFENIKIIINNYFIGLFFNLFEEDSISGLYLLNQLKKSDIRTYNKLQRVYNKYIRDDKNRISNTHVLMIIEKSLEKEIKKNLRTKSQSGGKQIYTFRKNKKKSKNKYTKKLKTIY